MVSPIYKRDLVLRHALKEAHNVASQERLVERLRADSLPTKEAEETLENLRKSLQAFERDLAAAGKARRALLGKC